MLILLAPRLLKFGLVVRPAGFPQFVMLAHPADEVGFLGEGIAGAAGGRPRQSQQGQADHQRPRATLRFCFGDHVGYLMVEGAGRKPEVGAFTVLPA